MNVSNYLAELWGITIVVVSLALLKKPKIIEKILAETQNEAAMFYWGVVSFIIGLAMVLAHNVWVPDWRTVITVLGWLTLAKGLDTLFFPEHLRKRWSQMKSHRWSWIFASLLLVGLVLIFLGFTA